MDRGSHPMAEIAKGQQRKWRQDPDAPKNIWIKLCLKPVPQEICFDETMSLRYC